MVRKVVKVSIRYTGTRRKLGKWIKPKRMVVNVTPKEMKKYGNIAIWRALKKKKSLRRKDFAWW